MSGIDKLISKSFSKSIKNNLPPDVLKNVERKLFLEEGMSIKLAIEHFPKLLENLKHNSSVDVKKFYNHIIEENIKIQKSDKGFCLKIINLELADMILQVFADNESRKILSSLLKNEMTIPDILKKSKIPKTSGYRKIENLIINGIIIEAGKVMSESKKISKYKCCFEEIKIKLNKNNFDIKCLISKKIFDDSSSINNYI